MAIEVNLMLTLQTELAMRGEVGYLRTIWCLPTASSARRAVSLEGGGVILIVNACLWSLPGAIVMKILLLLVR